MSAAPTSEHLYLGRTICHSRRDDFIVFVSARGKVPDDQEWASYVAKLKTWSAVHDSLQVLVLARDSAPTAAQRSLFNREVPSDKLRIAAILESKKLVPIAKVFAWFVRGIEAFGPTDLDRALHYLGDPPADVDRLLAELGVEASTAQHQS